MGRQPQPPLAGLASSGGASLDAGRPRQRKRGRGEAKTPPVSPPEDGLRETASQKGSQEAEGPFGGGGARIEPTRPMLRSQPLPSADGPNSSLFFFFVTSRQH